MSGLDHYEDNLLVDNHGFWVLDEMVWLERAAKLGTNRN